MVALKISDENGSSLEVSFNDGDNFTFFIGYDDDVQSWRYVNTNIEDAKELIEYLRGKIEESE